MRIKSATINHDRIEFTDRAILVLHDTGYAELTFMPKHEPTALQAMAEGDETLVGIDLGDLKLWLTMTCMGHNEARRWMFVRSFVKPDETVDTTNWPDNCDAAFTGAINSVFRNK